MKRMRMLIALLLVLCILPVEVSAASEEGLPYIQKMVQYYYHHQEAAQSEIDAALAQLKQVNPQEGELWEKIMADWSWCNSQMPITPDVLPDGLPQDDSLCIVILGYSLKDDGSLEDELLARLNVGLASARKYPNAYVAVTGGGTADDPSITEAGQMAQWLLDNGVEEDRIIIEDKSLSTNENAVNTYRILRDSYPTVTKAAVVSSDYHLPWGCAMFKIMGHYVQYSGGRLIEYVANAANATDQSPDTMFSQAWGVSVITHTPFDTESQAPALYWVPETTEYTPLPPVTQAPEPAPEVTVEENFEFQLWMAAPPVLLLAAAAIWLKTKQAKKRRRRENPVWKARQQEQK